MPGAPAEVVVAWLLALVLLFACIAAAIIRLVGRTRLGRWLRLDVLDGDE
jgi:hypothetical protein